MQITIESTTKTVHVNGVPARIWEGKTATGIPVHCYVTRIAVAENVDQSQFAAELEEHRAPSADVTAISSRLIL